MRALILSMLAACGGANYQTLQLTNQTSRPIAEIYVYPIGSANHGTSQRALAPNETAQIKVRGGRVELLAISSKVQIDERTRDQPSVTQGLELDRPLKIIFFDAASGKPPGLDRSDVIGVAFTLAKSNEPPPTSAPTE